MKRQTRGKRLSRRLKGLERELRLCRETLAGLGDAVFLVDTGLVVRWANGAAAGLVGIAVGSLTGRTCHQLWGAEEPCADCPCREGRAPADHQAVIAVDGGSGRRICRATPWTGAGGIVGAITVSRFAAQPAGGTGAVARRAGAQEEFAAETISLPCHRLDEEGRLVAVNEAWLTLLGYRREEVIGQPFIRFISPARREHFSRTFAFLLQRGEVSGAEMEICRRDGETVAVLADSRGSCDAEGSFRRTTCLLRPRPTGGLPGSTTELLPICSSCKKIRDSGGRWHEIEQYLNIHFQTRFSHGICPRCLLRLYPDFYH